MSARHFLETWAEFDGRPGTSATDVVTAVVVVMMALAMVGLAAAIVWATVRR